MAVIGLVGIVIFAAIQVAQGKVIAIDFALNLDTATAMGTVVVGVLVVERLLA